MKIYERQKGEGDIAFSVFQMYLTTEERTLSKIAEKSCRDASLIRKWAAKYNWRERAAAWDNKLLEDKRRAYIRRYNKFLDKQFEGNEKIQEKVLKAFEEKNIDKISWKSLNEIYRSNCAEMFEIAEKLGLNDAAGDNSVTIKIQKAGTVDDS